jgi:hypothetical protein
MDETTQKRLEELRVQRDNGTLDQAGRDELSQLEQQEQNQPSGRATTKAASTEGKQSPDFNQAQRAANQDTAKTGTDNTDTE